jgi:hypothetical protein
MRSLTNVSVRGTTTLAFSAARALVTDADGLIGTSATTATELGYVSGVTSSIQTQINNIAGGFGNIDGGTPSSNYGGIAPINGGNPGSF